MMETDGARRHHFLIPVFTGKNLNILQPYFTALWVTGYRPTSVQIRRVSLVPRVPCDARSETLYCWKSLRRSSGTHNDRIQSTFHSPGVIPDCSGHHSFGKWLLICMSNKWARLSWDTVQSDTAVVVGVLTNSILLPAQPTLFFGDEE